MPDAHPTTTAASDGNAANARRKACTDTVDGAREPENPIIASTVKSSISMQFPIYR
jgi:hypothetical protein